jgi:hypothetical protein
MPCACGRIPMNFISTTTFRKKARAAGEENSPQPVLFMPWDALKALLRLDTGTKTPLR